MPRNMSFSATLEQFRDRTKTVTRRKGWMWVKPGDELWGVEKAMGLKMGEKIKRLGLIRVVSVRREPVYKIGQEDCAREGFPHFMPSQFVQLYCRMNHCKPGDLCTRIEFEYLEDEI